MIQKKKKKKNIVRRGQVIFTWGIGNTIDVADGSSLMLAGLDAWERYMSFTRPDEIQFHDIRLEKKLGVNHFKLPPEFRKHRRDERIKNTNLYLPFVRFPLWHYCPFCGLMRGPQENNEEYLYITDSESRYEGLLCNNCKSYKPMAPSRFICICKDGHIQDFPFIEWAHMADGSKGNICEEPIIKMDEKRGTNLGNISIWCLTCKKRKSLFNMKEIIQKKFQCNGHRPWLGEVNDIVCKNELNATLRNASTVYNPIIKKSIYLINEENDIDERLREIVENNYSILNVRDSSNQTIPANFEVVSDRTQVPLLELKTAFQIIMGEREGNGIDENTTEEDYRFNEYNAIINNETSSELVLEKCKVNEYEKINKYFEDITLIHRLRETNAFCGFTRLNTPVGNETQERIKELRKNPYISDDKKWLPAIWNRGEGIFLQLNSKLLNEWERNNLVINRVQNILQEYDDYFHLFENLNQTFLLMHTLSHILINQISYECGYGSSSIKERIYFSNDLGNKMAGILLYTTGDSEGSLGGLVRLGKPGYLTNIFSTAINNAKWCSADPVCIESVGQGINGSNLAACHNCALVSETSCESGNRLLDRALLINDEYGFFNNL